MTPSLPYWILVFSTVVEIALLVLAIFFIVRLRRSEALVRALQNRQDEFLARLEANARLEKEIVGSFAKRQEELIVLEEKLALRATEMRRLLEQADTFTKSPQFLRQIILSGYSRGQSPTALARATGLSVDEVELIIDQPKA